MKVGNSDFYDKFSILYDTTEMNPRIVGIIQTVWAQNLCITSNRIVQFLNERVDEQYLKSFPKLSKLTNDFLDGVCKVFKTYRAHCIPWRTIRLGAWDGSQPPCSGRVHCSHNTRPMHSSP